MEKLQRCIFWEKPELVRVKGNLERVETFLISGRLLRHMLKCRECGQMYFYELSKEIETKNKKECYEQSAWVPILTGDVRFLKDLHPLELVVDSVFTPRIQEDISTDGKKKIYWIR